MAEDAKSQYSHYATTTCRPAAGDRHAYLSGAYLPAARGRGEGFGFFSRYRGAQPLSCRCRFTPRGGDGSGESAPRRDKEFQKGWEDYNIIGEPAYSRMETALLRAFDGIPELTPANRRQTRCAIFEMAPMNRSRKAAPEDEDVETRGLDFPAVGDEPVSLAKALSDGISPFDVYAGFERPGFARAAGKRSVRRAWQKLRRSRD